MLEAGRRRRNGSTRSVLHVTTVPASLIFVRGHVGYLKQRGWAVHVLSSPGPGLTEFGRRERVLTHTAPLIRSISPLRDLRALLRIARVIRAIRPTIVHAHTPKAGLIALLAAALFPSVIRIYEVRGLPLETATGFRRILLRTCERVTCRLAQRVICDSASLQQVLLAERICAAGKCTTLDGGKGNGVDAQQHWNPARIPAPAIDELRARLALRQGELVVGYVGRLASDKGIIDLERAWPLVREQHPTAQLLMVGSIDERDQAPEAALAHLHADASVHFAGQVEDPVPYFALMDVIVLPSYREGLPNVLLEAAAMGLPAVTTRVTGCVDAVQHGVTGMLVEPHSPAAVAQALNTYLADGALRRRHGMAAREHMMRDFRQESVWQACYVEYQKLLHAAGPLYGHSTIAGIARRGFDIAAASILLVLAAPLLAVIALAVRVDLGPPVLFRQVRAGVHGEPFTLHKFRTMRDTRDARGHLLPPQRRLTKLGYWLRATSLDELPELWDVLRGRMSIIGPRPLLMDYLPRYSREQARRHDVLPGITGWAQVNGRNAITWQEKFRLDAWYVDHASPSVDLRILLRTVPQVFVRRNITPRDRSMMEPFYGN